jgi:Domain of unknown function (DUF4158)
MPRQCILTAAERSALLAFPTKKSELIRLYTFSEQDLSVIKQRRGDAPFLEVSRTGSARASSFEGMIFLIYSVYSLAMGMPRAGLWRLASDG